MPSPNTKEMIFMGSLRENMIINTVTVSVLIADPLHANQYFSWMA
jgi:hypothetical protein